MYHAHFHGFFPVQLSSVTHTVSTHHGGFSVSCLPLLSHLDKTIQHACPHALIVFTVDQEKNNDFYEANLSENEINGLQ
jgi:hypothetical protein